MTDIYLHGIETIEVNNGPRPVATIDTGVIGLVGTAPDADATLWPLDEPVLVSGLNDDIASLGTNGTLYDAIEGIRDQSSTVSQTIVVVRVEEDADPMITMSNIIGSANAKTGLNALTTAQSELQVKPKLLIAPGFTSIRPTDGIVSISVDSAGTGYTEPPTVEIVGDGNGASAVATINSDTGVLEAITVTNPGGGYTSATVNLTGGGGSGAAATATLGQVSNPVVAEMFTVANRLRAGLCIDAPNTNYADVIQYRMDYDVTRPVKIIHPFVKVFRDGQVVDEPASARVAGLQAHVDYSEGFWVDCSNHVIEGVIGTSRPIEHSISDRAAESQQFNKNDVCVVARSQSGGIKLWGLRNPTSDPLNAFWSVRRSHDTIIESIEIAHEPFLGKPFSLQVLTEIGETVNRALRRWQALGATLGGRVWLDPDLNTPSTWQSGLLYVSYDAEGPAPLEHIVFMFNRNQGYYKVLAEDAIAEVNRIAATQQLGR